MKIYKVFTKFRALTCIEEGCNLLYTEPNHKKPMLNVFCFEESEKLHEILTRLNKK